MTAKGSKTLLCEDNLRHAEYYGMQSTFDSLYEKSKNGQEFTNLMSVILSRENILLAYRNLKTNAGSKTPGTDGLTIGDVGKLPPEEIVKRVTFIANGSHHGYRPKPVRRKDIPKPYDPTKTRPLGIPCIWDRLFQQCIKQVLEPICEAKFSENSYGFRPNRSVEQAISKTYRLLQLSHLHYVIEFDIKGFFDNVNHSKLMRQIWSLGIHDKQLIFIIRRMLTAPIKMPDGKMIIPDKGTPQGGIISPLLANIVLNELDRWIESQWEDNPVTHKYYVGLNASGGERKSNGYRAMQNSRLKEMFIVRYADDFRVFCRTKTDADRTKIAVTKWLAERLRLEVSREKTRIVNVKRQYSNFLGFKIKVFPKGNKQVVRSHIADKNLAHKRQKMTELAKGIAHPRKEYGERGEIYLFDSAVIGIQNYYNIATRVCDDLRILQRAVMTTLTNRLRSQRGNRLVKTGRPLSEFEQKRYGGSKMLRYVAGSNEPIYPLGFVQHKHPMPRKRTVCAYTAEGRKEIHNNLQINTALMLSLMRSTAKNRSCEYADNRISLFSAQWGKCAVTGRVFRDVSEIHCHHKTPQKSGGRDSYDNLVLVLEPVHKLIHATKESSIQKYLSMLNLSNSEIDKVNTLREKANLKPIT